MVEVRGCRSELAREKVGAKGGGKVVNHPDPGVEI